MSTTVITSAPGWSAALMPQNTEEAWKIATTLAKSSLVPKQFSGQPGEILIAAAMGARLGLDVFSSLQSIAVINNRPTIWGDGLLAICQRRTDWRGMKIEWSGKGDEEAVRVTVSRQIADSIQETPGSFSVADAKRAGLWTKQGPWSLYPKRMMETRARNFAIRNGFADAIMGFEPREDAEDAPPIDVTASATVRDEAPKGRKIKQVDASPAPVAQAHAVDEPTTQTATVGPSEASESSAGEVATGESATEPTLDQVRAAVNRAASAVGGARKIIEAIEKMAGYSVMKADDIKPEHRAEAIKIADEFAGIGA
jgi:hypothetical protein